MTKCTNKCKIIVDFPRFQVVYSHTEKAGVTSKAQPAQTTKAEAVQEDDEDDLDIDAI